MRTTARGGGRGAYGLAVALASVLCAPPSRAGDAAAGRRQALACQACHGLDGVSKLPEAPNLSGQVEAYLVKALTEYRDGTRRHELMSVVAKDLSDVDMANLAAYYSNIQVEVIPPS